MADDFPHPHTFYRLSHLENSMQEADIQLQWVLPKEAPLDVMKLATALRRVVEKWRILAGRLEWMGDKQTGYWAIRYPTGPIPTTYKLMAFTSSTHKKSALSAPLPALLPTSALLLVPPSPNLFHGAGTKRGNRERGASGPILFAHVGIYDDCTCVGLSSSHGIFDAKGLGLVVKAWNAEFHGLDWTVPEVDHFYTFRSLIIDCSNEPHLERRDWVPWGAANIAKMLAAIAYERLWHSAEPKVVFLGKEVVERLVTSAKKEVKDNSEGKDWVSTGDVLVAWMLKAAYSEDTDLEAEVHVNGAFCARELVSHTAGLHDNYPHNTIHYYELPALTVSTLQSLPVSSLALSFRQALNAYRTMPSLRRALSPYSKEGNQALTIPATQKGAQKWTISNQTDAGLPEMDFGCKADLWCETIWPIDSDHRISVNKFGDGWVMEGIYRRARWAAVKNQLDLLLENGK